MRFQGAVIREQGQTFAVVVVQRHIIDNQSTAAVFANCTAIQAYDKANKAATRTLKTFAALTVEYTSAVWVGLGKVQQQARAY